MNKEKIQNIFMKVIVILGIIILPVIYSYFYLNGFWDPYNKLDAVPVAVVNLDECNNNCQGEKVVDEILKDGTFDFKEVSESEANKGLINKKYFSVIKIPKDFTKNINNISSSDRKNVEIYYSPNVKTSYLVAQFTNTAVKQISDKLNLNIATTAVEDLTKNIQSTFNQTKQISTGFSDIASGTYQLKSGTIKLSNGTNSLNNKYIAFDKAVKKIDNGSNTINSKMVALSQGANKLNTGILSLQKAVSLGTKDLTSEQIELLKQAKLETDGAISELTEVNEELYKGYTVLLPGVIQTVFNDQASVGLNTLKNANVTYTNISSICSTDALRGIANGVLAAKEQSTYSSEEDCLKGFNKIIVEYDNNYEKNQNLILLLEGDKKAVESLLKLAGNLSTLKQGTDELASGSNELTLGIKQLKDGVNTLNTGINDLSKASTKVNNGINTLNDGTSSLKDGAETLNDGVNEAKDTIDQKINNNKKSVEDLNGLSDYTKDAVKVDKKDYGTVNDYGTFFSPYFMSLSLWVGGILILMGLYYDPEKRFRILGKETESRGKRLVFYNIIGIIQAIMLAFILKTCLGFEVTNVWLFYGSCILISEAFLSIIMFLFFAFKDVGKFLSLVFLVLQLASCGGTFPIQTEPTLYQIVYPFMPMTYSVDLLRESFVSINSSFLCKDVLILIVILVVFTLLTFITSYIKTKKEGK